MNALTIRPTSWRKQSGEWGFSLAFLPPSSVASLLCPRTSACSPPSSPLDLSRSFLSTLSVFRSDLPDTLSPPCWAAYWYRLHTFTELRSLTGENLRHCGKLMGEVLWAGGSFCLLIAFRLKYFCSGHSTRHGNTWIDKRLFNLHIHHLENNLLQCFVRGYFVSIGGHVWGEN